jgi:hypothetical protein
MSNPYIIFVGHKADDMQPFESAATQEEAVNKAIELRDAFPCVEAVYMPEEDIDTNEVVYINK